MKKIFTILLLMIFFYTQVVYYLAYSILRYGETERIEHHILSTMPESECKIINLTANANRIHWEKTDEIFILNGVMYDVTKIKNTGGNIYAYCITEEEEMKKMADCSLTFSSAANSLTDLDLAFSVEYILQNNKTSITPPLLNSLPLSSAYSKSLTQRCKNIILPPPRVTVS